MKFFTIISYTLLSLFLSMSSQAIDYIQLFPVSHYDQSIDTLFSPTASDYEQRQLSKEKQEELFQDFYRHYFETNETGLSPWSENTIKKLLDPNKQESLKSLINTFLIKFDNASKSASEINYGENFRPYDPAWLEKIKENMQVEQFDQLHFDPEKRAISIDNLAARLLPTDDPSFYDFNIPNQGYPFDNLQNSAIYAGEPLYVFGESRDHAWVLIMGSHQLIGWVKSTGIAYVDNHFIKIWQKQAKQHLLAITHPETPIVDNNNHFYFYGYPGMTLPIKSQSSDNYTVLIPRKNKQNQAEISTVTVNSSHSVLMPLTLTHKNMALLIKENINRPYGWGGSYFYNDCSQEMIGLFTPFGIWLPRNSYDQSQAYFTMDFSSLNENDRLMQLSHYGKKLTTLIYINGHIMLYLGEADNSLPMTYQNIWRLRSKTNAPGAIIGRSLIFPLLTTYPEDSDLASLTSRQFFKLTFLNENKEPGTFPSLKSLIQPAWLFNKNN